MAGGCDRWVPGQRCRRRGVRVRLDDFRGMKLWNEGMMNNVNHEQINLVLSKFQIIVLTRSIYSFVKDPESPTGKHWIDSQMTQTTDVCTEGCGEHLSQSFE